MKDNFSKHAASYAKYRPAYPRALYEFVVSRLHNKRAAWDCGTGNGQAAIEIAKEVELVQATDISEKQIENAPRAKNIVYSVQPVEHTSFPNDSFDLITVAQALHWFKLDDFYSEVKRVARQGAVLAAWTYSLVRISTEIDALIAAHHFNTLARYWDDERKYVDAEYKTIPFPFEKIQTPVFFIDYEWTKDELEGYLNTWSGLQNFMRVHPYNPVDELMVRIRPFWLSEKMKISFPIHLLMGRIEK